ncbi:protein da1-related 2 [Phtheirospermum japonicum]|uniref:Protein da1-related 2 n=1 Tax=Phtheirospermum japonicum TaxID=374723 RepID=A0A830DL26_9LAMI|nr:protein da1-related 2 [Phtheirospermum japonicum]
MYAWSAWSRLLWIPAIVNRLYHSIRDFYEGMNMRINQQIPMLLVERHALNEAIEGEKHGFHHMPETRGLCLSEEQTVTSVNSSVLKRPRIERAGLVGIRTQPQKLIRKCEVTAILVLYGLPRLLTGAILAHELMHGWLRLNGYRNLAPEVEEGICQVLSSHVARLEVLPETRHMPFHVIGFEEYAVHLILVISLVVVQERR